MAFDRTDPADLAALKSEVNTDPTGLGYQLDNTNQIIATINETRPAIQVAKPAISPSAVRSATTFDAYDTLSIDEQEWLRWITGSSGIEDESLIVTADLRLRLHDEGGNGSIWAPAHRVEMNAAMLALTDVDGSRAEELFGYATTITEQDWFSARDS